MLYHVVEIGFLALLTTIEVVRFAASKKRDSTDLSCDDSCKRSCCTYDAQTKLYVTCVCTRVKNGQRVYKSFVVDDLPVDGLTATDISNLSSRVLADHPEFKDCVILSFQKIQS